MDRAAYVFTGAGYQQEKALILCEVYRKDGIWRFSVVDSGFNGGLSALLAHFGGEEVKPDPPTPAPAPPEPKVNLSKISLKKSGESHKIDLTKNRRRIHVNLNWDQRRGLFSRGIDLDLACMYRLKDGGRGSSRPWATASVPPISPPTSSWTRTTAPAPAPTAKTWTSSGRS